MPEEVEQNQNQVTIVEPNSIDLSSIELTPELRSILERLKFSGLPNIQTNAVGGSVPTAVGLKVAQYKLYDDRVEVSLRFLEPKVTSSSVQSYNVYVSGAILANELSAPFTVSGSPAKISVPLSPFKTGVITFTVQTVLKNGFSSDPINSPTTALILKNPSQQANSNSLITNSSTITTNNTTFAELFLPANTINDRAAIRMTFIVQLTHAGIGGQTGVNVYLNDTTFGLFGALTNTQTVVGTNSEWNKLQFEFFFQPGSTSIMDSFASFYRSESNANITRAGSVPGVSVNKTINNKIILQTNFGGGVGQSMLIRAGWYEIFNNAGSN